jgi:hypothetical protein
VIAFNPHPGNTAWALKKAASSYRPITNRVLQATLFPDRLEDEAGEFRKPESW